MPLAPSDLTMYYLHYRDGRLASAVLEPETRAVSLFPDAGNIDDDPVPAGSSDYDGPVL